MTHWVRTLDVATSLTRLMRRAGLVGALLLVGGVGSLPAMAAPTAMAQTALADGSGRTADPNLRNPACTTNGQSTAEPTSSRPTPQVLAPTGTSSATTPSVSRPSPTPTTPTLTTTAGCITLFSTPSGNSAHVLHVGPDDNFWFPDGSNIVRMLSRAPYTQTDFPIPGGAPFQITTGPDGNISSLPSIRQA